MGIEMKVSVFKMGISQRLWWSIVGGLLTGVLLALTLSAVPRESMAPKFSVPFVENDYSKALADAQTRNIPIFVDMWAPW